MIHSESACQDRLEWRLRFRSTVYNYSLFVIIISSSSTE